MTELHRQPAETPRIVPAAGAAVLSLAFIYGGVAQMLAGVWAFAKGNAFAATAFVSIGAFWISFWWLEINPAVARQAGAAGIGIYLLGWAVFTAYMSVAAMKTNRVMFTVFVLLAVTFLSLALGALTGASELSQAGGWAGLATEAAAWYGSAASAINSTWGRVVLPTGKVKLQPLEE